MGSIVNYLPYVLKQPNGKLLVEVNHNQLRTMASETVDPIDWSHPPPSWAVPPERHVHSINQYNFSGTRTCNRSIRGNHLAYAATQGMVRKFVIFRIASVRRLLKFELVFKLSPIEITDSYIVSKLAIVSCSHG